MNVPKLVRRNSVFSKNYSVSEHLNTLKELNQIYKTRIDTSNPINSEGLTEIEATQILLQKGKNVLTPPKQLSEFKKFMGHILDLFNILLAIAAILSFLAFVLSPESLENFYLGK